jgi:hypothetical protein
LKVFNRFVREIFENSKITVILTRNIQITSRDQERQTNQTLITLQQIKSTESFRDGNENFEESKQVYFARLISLPIDKKVKGKQLEVQSCEFSSIPTRDCRERRDFGDLCVIGLFVVVFMIMDACRALWCVEIRARDLLSVALIYSNLS